MLWCKRLTLVCVLLLAGCGFRPVYTSEPATAQNPTGSAGVFFDQIFIEPIEDREGQYLRNELLRLLDTASSGRKRYSLSVTLTESKRNLAVQRTSLSTRANLRMTASYTLRDQFGDEKSLLTGEVAATSGYNIFQSEFQTLSAEQGARERAIEFVAEQLRLRLAAYAKDPEPNDGAS